MLQIKNLYLKYTREYFALYDINISIQPGESVALVGQDESGKTSLLRILAKFEKPSKGEVYIKDIPLKKLNYKTDISAGYVPATPVFKNKKTVYENFKYILKERGLSESEIESKINNVLIDYSIEKIKDQKISELTLEEKYVLSFIRLSFRELELLMIDNIFDNISQTTLDVIINLIKQLKTKNTTLLIATTKPEIAQKLCKRNVYFKNGSIVDSLSKIN